MCRPIKSIGTHRRTLLPSACQSALNIVRRAFKGFDCSSPRDEFTVLGLAEVRSPQLVIVSHDWPTRIRINDGPVERSTARCSVSVPPEVAQFSYLARDDGLMGADGTSSGPSKGSQDGRQRSNETILIDRLRQRNREDRTVCV